MSEAPYVLDGLHHQAHQTDLRIAEHYTDTAGATDHVFGLCHLLGFRFAPRIKDLKDRKLYTIDKPSTYPLLEPLIGDMVETVAITNQWTELLRLKASIQAGVRRGDHSGVERSVSAGHMGVKDNAGIDAVLGVDGATGSGATASAEVLAVRG